MSRIPYLLTAFLEPGEAAQVRALAAGSVLAEAAVEESYHLKELLDRGRDMNERESDELLMALMAVPGADGEPWCRELIDRIKADDGLAGRWEAMHEEALRLDCGAEQQFERLVGPRPAARSRAQVFGGWAAALVFLVLAHGMFSSLTEDPVRKAVWMDYRDAGPQRASLAGLTDIELARRAVYSARRSTAGLWPRFDADLLAGAERYLAGLDTAEALLERGRIALLRGDHGRARVLLGSVKDDPSAGEAARLLELLDRYGR